MSDENELHSATTSSQAHLSDEEPIQEEATCRICRCEGTPDDPLFHPCKCRGSIKYIHQECLTAWLAHSNKKICDICKTPFAFKTVYDANTPDKVPFPVVLQRLIRKFIKFLIRGVIVFVTALVLTLEFPLFISAMFRVDNWLLGCNLPSARVMDSMLYGTDEFDKVNLWSIKNLEIIVLNSYAAGWSILLTLGVIGLSLGVIHSGVVSDEGLVKILHKRIGPEPRMNRIAQALNPNWGDNGNAGGANRNPRIPLAGAPVVPAAAAPEGGIDGQARVQQLQDRLLETERLARQLNEIENLMQNNIDDNNNNNDNNREPVNGVANPPEENNDVEQGVRAAPVDVAGMPNDDFDGHAERIRERMGTLWDEVERAHILRAQEAIAENDNVRLAQIRRERDLIHRFREENGRLPAPANPQNQQQNRFQELEEQPIEEQIQQLQQNQQRQQPRVRQRDDGNFIEEELWKIVLAVHLATFLVLFVVYFMPSLLGMLWINILNGVGSFIISSTKKIYNATSLEWIGIQVVNIYNEYHVGDYLHPKNQVLQDFLHLLNVKYFAPYLDIYNSTISWTPKADLFERLVVMSAGYAFALTSVLGLMYKLASGCSETNPLTGSFRSIYVPLLELVCTLKVGCLFSIEWMIFPLHCGTLLRFCLLPITSSDLYASLMIPSEEHVSSSSAILSNVGTWVLGTFFMYHFASFVGMIRSHILRKGVLFFIRPSDDPNIRLVHDALMKPFGLKLSRIAMSGDANDC
ncbi:unnamed protein product [Ambrosiozyma monospora]|uniref:RING-type E3 ubiquitin transferase n=1 Tax=Ambrosiozyma monospora TaxID=43982 RepID=A0A9W7DJ88_AMBMO|nr:unnamed protein product [Ambrosiozyma monospora]